MEKRPGNTEGGEYIARAAIRIGRDVFTGKDHEVIIESILNDQTIELNEIGNRENGFVTNTGRFVSREEGANIYYRTHPNKTRKNKLYSEDLD